MKNLSKILIILALITIVAVVIVLKNQPENNIKESTDTESSVLESTTDPQKVVKEPILSEKEEESETGIDSEEQTETVKEEPKKIKQNIQAETKNTVQSKDKKAAGDVIAIVEGVEITESELQEEYKKLSPQYQDMFKNDKDLYLEQLIIKEILVQKAIEKGYIKSEKPSPSQQDSGIQKLIDEMGKNIEISEAELEAFYQENQDQMKGASFDEMKNNIRNYLIQQKQNEKFENYIDDIRNDADVVLNEDWIAQQIASKPENPLNDALQNGLPTVLDLGSDSCIPCQMMMPIFDELKKELEGKANVILLQIADYRNLANEYKVRVIPTQIFFDQNGEQYWRHEGYLAKEDIIKKLKETGVKL